MTCKHLIKYGYTSYLLPSIVPITFPELRPNTVHLLHCRRVINAVVSRCHTNNLPMLYMKLKVLFLEVALAYLSSIPQSGESR